jgi:hypothetical protein
MHQLRRKKKKCKSNVDDLCGSKSLLHTAILLLAANPEKEISTSQEYMHSSAHCSIFTTVNMKNQPTAQQ